jgi:hypothetical protein
MSAELSRARVPDGIAAIDNTLADREETGDESTKAIVERTGPWAGERTMEAFGGRWPRGSS